MSRGTRVLLTLLVCGSLLAATTVGISVAAVYRAGSIAVEVREGDGQQLHVAVPAGLARLAIWLTPASVLEPVLVEEIHPLVPALRAGWRELLRAPDFVLAEVRDRDDRCARREAGRRDPGSRRVRRLDGARGGAAGDHRSASDQDRARLRTPRLAGTSLRARGWPSGRPLT